MAELKQANKNPIRVLLTDPMCVADQFKCLKRPPTNWGYFHRQAYCQKRLLQARDYCRHVARLWPHAVRDCSLLPQEDLTEAWRLLISRSSTQESCSVYAPSTGLVAIVHLRRLCSTSRLFGFAPRNTSRRGHYWSPGSTLRKEVDLSLERGLLQEWHAVAPQKFALARRA